MKYIAIILLIITTITIKAQEAITVIPKGTTSVGGSISLWFNETSSKDNNGNAFSTYSTSSLGIGPQGGYYIKDNLAVNVGVGYGYSLTKNESENTSESKSQSHSANLYFQLRKNYKIIPNVFFFAQISSGVGFGFDKNENNINNVSKNRFLNLSAGVSPGIQIFLTNKISLESTLGYLGYGFSRWKNPVSDYYIDSHRISLSGINSLSFSVQYYFLKKVE